MAAAQNRFNLQLLRKQLRPFRLHWVPRVRSTNDLAAMLRKRGQLFAPAIVLTGNQIAGRGRNSNTWWSGPGSLTATFVLPIDEHLLPHQLPLIAGLAVRSAVSQFSRNDDVQLKWPNDLIYQGKKLAGLLCERVHKADLIGLGLNVNIEAGVPRSLRDRIVWLSRLTVEGGNSLLDKAQVLIEVAKHLYPMLTRPREHPFAGILREYDRHHALKGKRITVWTNSHDSAAISGVCQGLDSMGRLLLRDRGGHVQRVIAGQVQIHDRGNR